MKNEVIINAFYLKFKEVKTKAGRPLFIYKFMPTGDNIEPYTLFSNFSVHPANLERFDLVKLSLDIQNPNYPKLLKISI